MNRTLEEAVLMFEETYSRKVKLDLTKRKNKKGYAVKKTRAFFNTYITALIDFGVIERSGYDCMDNS